MKRYEIGFVQFFYGSAKEVVKGFTTSDEAHDEARKRNQEIGCTRPGRGKWGWVVAEEGEIPLVQDDH